MVDCVFAPLYNRIRQVFFAMFIFVYKGLKYPHIEAISATWAVIQCVWVCVLVSVPALIDGCLW